jgi:hypothetical protein
MENARSLYSTKTRVLTVGGLGTTEEMRGTVRLQEGALQGLLRRPGGSLVVHGSRASTAPERSCTNELVGDDLPAGS